MNIDEPGDGQVIDEHFHGEFDESLFQDVVTDGILDPNSTKNGSCGPHEKPTKIFW